MKRNQPWTAPGWLESVRPWVDTTLDRHGLRRTGDLDQVHVRPWSTVVRAPSNGGDLFLKANGPACAHEAAVLSILRESAVPCVPDVLALHAEQGWILMAGAGEQLRPVLKRTSELGHWRMALSAYAQAQRAAATSAAEMLAHGVPDYRVATLPERFERLMEDTRMLAIGQEFGMTAEEYARLSAFGPQLRAMCEELSAFGIADTIEHGDLHDGNICLAAGRITFIDWGDSAVAHPFCSLRVALESVERTLGADATTVESLRDGYLEAWSGALTLPELRRASFLVERAARVSGALKWQRILTSVDDPYPPGYPLPVPTLLKELLQG